MITIDKGIPMPENNGKQWSYPLVDMQVGDSFFVPGKRTADVRSSLEYYKRTRNPDARFTSRSVIENEVRGVRIWRIA